MSAALKARLKGALRAGERLSPLHPRAYPLKGWWRGGVELNTPSPEGWPLPPHLAVIEGREGYQFGPENLTLAWVLEGFLEGGERGALTQVVELGAGSASLGLIGAFTVGAERLVLLERQASQLDRLQRLVEALKAHQEAHQEEHKLTSWPHLELIEGDLREPEALERARDALEGGEADLVVLNPPFFPQGWGRASASEEVHASTHALHGGVLEFLEAASALTREDGLIIVLYDALRLADCLPALARLKLSLVRLCYTPDLRPEHLGEPFRVWLVLSRDPARRATPQVCALSASEAPPSPHPTQQERL